MNYAIELYDNVINHAGITRLIKTICIHFGWPGLQKEVKNFVNTCDKCQHFHISGKITYRKIYLQPSLCNKIAWQQLYIDLCCKWIVKFNHKATCKRTKTPTSHSMWCMHQLMLINASKKEDYITSGIKIRYHLVFYLSMT